MKKLVKSALALATILFASACMQENHEPVQTGSTVTFSVEVPETVATKALFENGENLNNLVYAVYKTDAANLEQAQNLMGENMRVYQVSEATAFVGGKTNVTLELINDQNYIVLFWAQVDNTWVGENSDLTNITYPSDLVANNDMYSAFSGVAFVEKVDGARAETVTLTRPFAQINIAAADPVRYNVDVTTSKVMVFNAASSFNVATQSASGNTDVEYGAATNPEGSFNGYEHYVAMNYVFANGNVSVAYEINTEKHGTISTYDAPISNVPVAKNYRTNIVGNLLTSNVDYNVELDQEWAGADLPNEGTADHLKMVAQLGGEVTLTADVTLSETLVVSEGVKMVIDLNGKTITGTMHKSVGAVIKNNGTLAINGGTISSLAKNGGSAIANYGNLTVENVTISGAQREGDSWPAYPINNYGSMTLTNAVLSGYQGCVALNAAGTTILNNCELTKNYEKTSSHVFYVNHADAKVIVNGGTYNHNGFDGSLAYVNNGEVTINGGTFNAKDGGYGFAVLNGGKMTINGGNINAGLLGRGGQFVLNGGVYASKPSKEIIAQGYKAVEKNNKWYIVAGDVDAVATTAEDLSAALIEGKSVVISNDIAIAESEAGSNGYGATGISQLNGGVIDGNGNSISVDAWGTWDSAINTTGGTIKNLNVTGGMRGIFVNHNGTKNSKVVLENVTIDGTVYTISCDQGTNQGLEAYNSTFNGWTSYAATIGAVKFDGCSFGEGQGYAFCRPYAETEFVNCDFEAGYALDPCAAVTFSNCTIGGVALTAENASVLVTSNKYPVKVDGLIWVADGVVKDSEEYAILNAAGMFWLADQVNDKKEAFNGKTVKLAADIDLDNAAWTPVGQTGATTFNGVFDGQEHTISNLNVNSDNQTGAHYSSGLFGWVESHTEGRGHIKNVKIAGATIVGHHNCGALVGYITQETALVENCHVTGATITCTKANDDADGDKAGALIGNATTATPVKNCTAANSIVSAGRDAGQLIGAGKEANVSGCSAADVSVSANGTGTGANVRNEVIGRLL